MAMRIVRQSHSGATSNSPLQLSVTVPIAGSREEDSEEDTQAYLLGEDAAMPRRDRAAV